MPHLPHEGKVTLQEVSVLGKSVLAAKGEGMFVRPPLVLFHQGGVCGSQLVGQPWGNAGEYGMCVFKLLPSRSFTFFINPFHLIQRSVQQGRKLIFLSSNK